MSPGTKIIAAAAAAAAAAHTLILRTTNVDDTYNGISWSFGTCWITICSLSFPFSTSCKVRLDRRRRDDFYPFKLSSLAHCDIPSWTARIDDRVESCSLSLAPTHTSSIAAQRRMITSVCSRYPRIKQNSGHDTRLRLDFLTT
jgi:hypothetical protein